jgi:hypothetical protein
MRGEAHNPQTTVGRQRNRSSLGVKLQDDRAMTGLNPGPDPIEPIARVGQISLSPLEPIARAIDLLNN